MPRLEGEIVRAIHAEVIDDAESRQPIAQVQIEQAARSLEQVAATGIIGGAARDASRAWALLAARPGAAPAENRAHFEAIYREAERSLITRPADRFTWYRLAYAATHLGRWLEAARALHMSIRTGAFDYDLMNARAQAIFVLWPYMDEAARRAAGDHMRGHWQWQPGGLAGIAWRMDADAIALAAARPYPDMRADLEARLVRIRRELGPPR